MDDTPDLDDCQTVCNCGDLDSWWHKSEKDYACRLAGTPVCEYHTWSNGLSNLWYKCRDDKVYDICQEICDFGHCNSWWYDSEIETACNNVAEVKGTCDTLLAITDYTEISECFYEYDMTSCEKICDH